MSDLIQWFNQNDGFILALLTIVYVGATLVIVVIMMKANRIAAESIDTIKRLDEERTRPSVFFQLSTKLVGAMNVFAEIQNLGLRTAYNIKIEIEPKLERDNNSHKAIGIIEDGIASLPPNAKFSTFVGLSASLRQQQKLHFTGTVTYQDQEGKVFSEPFKWNLPSSGDLIHIDRKSMHDLAKTLEKIEQNISRVASGSKKPLFRVISEGAYREEQQAEYERLIAMSEEAQENDKEESSEDT